MSALLDLAKLGQRYWLDDLSRPMIESGELLRRVREEGLTGVTVNPAIFRAAIHASDAYDEQIDELAGQSAERIYEALVVTDVREACDILRSVYDRTEGRDGFVSLEVSPHLARDAAASIAEARRFWQAVGRPNLLIKIPGTAEGVPAIEALLFEGINVNITLLFAVDRYEEVARAYMSALERRKAADVRLDSVASVASFFLSRIDTAVDKQLRQRMANGSPQAERLLGKVAIANARLAYRRFRELLSSARWHSLEAVGARPQRLLWASTSTKDPAYDDLMYVEPLIGPDTITTLPRKTSAAFAERGKAASTLEKGLDEAEAVLHELAALGIDLRRVTDRLLDEGVAKFIESFDDILRTITEKTAARTTTRRTTSTENRRPPA